MRAVFRVDASGTIGSGHVMRCLALASALRARGFACAFVCRAHPGHLGTRIQSEGHALQLLPAPTDFAADGHAGWLGASWQRDAGETRAALRALGAAPDWLVVDHYGIDARWERELRADATALFAIDDLADREHAVEALLDQNLAPAMHRRYRGRVPDDCALLLGPRHALLQPGYAALHAQARPRQGGIRRLLVHFGATDPHGMVLRTLDALATSAPATLEVDLVLPADEGVRAAARARAGADARLHLHQDLPGLAPLVAAADLALGAGGVASWERICLGLPALVLSVAENQRAIAAETARRGLSRYLGHADALSTDALAAALSDAFAKGADEEMSRRCLEAVDGRGAERVAGLLAGGLLRPLRARAVHAGDEALLLEWANDPGTRRHAFSPAQIEPDVHHAWLQARLGEGGDCRFYVVESATGEPLASVRFQRGDGEFEVHFTVAPGQRGQGLGRRVVATAMAQFQADTMAATTILGRVQEGNSASSRIFESLGFEEQPRSVAGMLSYRRRT